MGFDLGRESTRGVGRRGGAQSASVTVGASLRMSSSASGRRETAQVTFTSGSSASSVAMVSGLSGRRLPFRPDAGVRRLILMLLDDDDASSMTPRLRVLLRAVDFRTVGGGGSSNSTSSSRSPVLVLWGDRTAAGRERRSTRVPLISGWSRAGEGVEFGMDMGVLIGVLAGVLAEARAGVMRLFGVRGGSWSTPSQISNRCRVTIPSIFCCSVSSLDSSTASVLMVSAMRPLMAMALRSSSASSSARFFRRASSSSAERCFQSSIWLWSCSPFFETNFFFCSTASASLTSFDASSPRFLVDRRRVSARVDLRECTSSCFAFSLSSSSSRQRCSLSSSSASFCSCSSTSSSLDCN
eukprot:Sspe_Gene.33306::Locus_16266_Transcript_1_1_Confidence_1.000_Length_3541::g.33306::m.33306